MTFLILKYYQIDLKKYLSLKVMNCLFIFFFLVCIEYLSGTPIDFFRGGGRVVKVEGINIIYVLMSIKYNL